MNNIIGPFCCALSRDVKTPALDSSVEASRIKPETKSTVLGQTHTPAPIPELMK